MSKGTIRVGIGGWTYEPWRGGTFYPEGLAQKRELEHAASAMTAIEINGTYYSSFKPASFETWAKAVPDGFVFTAKASRYVTNRKVLAEAGESIERFLGQGITALGDKLGPILWQFMATKKFDADDFGAFLKLLPAAQDGVKLRHAVHVRHESFRDPAFVAMARAAGVAIVNAWSDDYPGLGDVSGDFVYARFENAIADEPQGFPAATIDRFADWVRAWAAGKPAGDLPTAGDPAPAKPRDVFAFMINGAKERAPAAAQALIERVGRP
ncbi:DUF72 domain-containing protein [Sphingomonas yantingensis]|uniref:Uncharacterized protein YecE (DUF72 family) n=1 Tax=Sphingomonas yantingensis TaxID=1241761 RepID=A0A7W9AP96_9SPHN|nr:DUF72 domain-containing protein [Sphingomonas yantingensis]MBB5698072.1 uncharacterized protein YecE (DUF72 family) [Sphingomonas yantingensis]